MFCIWDVLGTGHFEAWDVLRLGRFGVGTFVAWTFWGLDVLRLGMFCIWDVLELGRFVFARSLVRRFMPGRFVGEP
jgi:hypothetical protein